jgi:hypothetical protein
MPTEESKALLRYLVGASRTSLGEFYLHRLARVADAERDIAERLRALVEDLAMVQLANFLREHGEEICELLSSPQQSRRR